MRVLFDKLLSLRKSDRGVLMVEILHYVRHNKKAAPQLERLAVNAEQSAIWAGF
jgi:hypothetical protein